MHGSLVNRLMEGPTAKVPEIGMGVTITHWSDREPGTIVEVTNFKSGARAGQPKEFVVQYDAWKVVSGSAGDGSAKYEYERDPEGRTVTFAFNVKRQRWVEAKTDGKGSGVILGRREKYYDPHF